MQTFKVIRRVDAYVNYAVEVQAETAHEATRLAYEQEDVLPWEEEGVSEFDNRIFTALDADGNELEESVFEIH